MKASDLSANLCGGLVRQSLWRTCPPIFVEDLSANLCGGLVRLCRTRAKSRQ